MSHTHGGADAPECRTCVPKIPQVGTKSTAYAVIAYKKKPEGALETSRLTFPFLYQAEEYANGQAARTSVFEYVYVIEAVSVEVARVIGDPS